MRAARYSVAAFVILFQLQLNEFILGSSEVHVCIPNESRLPSLYEQYCCVDDNRGKSIILESGHKQTHFLCPLKVPAFCPLSCSSTSHLTATSGYYNIMLANGTVVTVYCDMEGVNCDGEGGWMRVGYLNMSDSGEQCPPGFRLYEENGIRACGRQSSGCQSVKFPSLNINYTQVCGRVTGYQKGSPDAIDSRLHDINGAYADGVSITRGNPRKHVWTFMGSLQEEQFALDGQSECPCAPNSPVTPESFIGNDYFCESGNPGAWDKTTFHSHDPLWDGKQCGAIEKACCNVTGIPWFNKVLEQPNTDYIELRVCGDQMIIDEDSPVSYYEIYVK